MQKLIWTNANGDSVDLTSGHYGITNWEGFSNTSLNIQTQQVPFQDGGVFLDALMEQRELTVTLAMNDEGSLEKRYQLRRELIHILNPKLGEGYLIYKNDFTQKRIKCVPQIPLFETHNSDTVGTPKASLSWTACEPYWEDLEETSIIFTPRNQPIINNAGDVQTYPKIEISSEDSSDLIIKNMKTKQSINYQDELKGRLVIDTDIGKKKVFSETLKNFPIEGNFTVTSVIYSKEIQKYILILGTNLIYVSTDLENWEEVGHNVNGTFTQIIYSKFLELFIIVGTRGVEAISENGIDWIQPETNIAETLYSTKIVSADNLEKLIMIGNNKIYESTNGVEWTLVYTATGTDFTQSGLCLCYSDSLSLFIVLSGQLSHYFTSSDGENWVDRTIPDSVGLYNVVYSKKRSMFLITDANNKVFTSSDGENWVVVNNKISNSVYTYLYYNEKWDIFIICGNNNLEVSNDGGVTWEYKINNIYIVIYSDDEIIFAGFGNFLRKAISVSGESWTLISTNQIQSGYTLVDMCCAKTKNIWVALSTTSTTTGQMFYSQDGLNWTSSNRQGHFTSICYSQELGKFVAVGQNAGITQSYDGVNWLTITQSANYIYIVYIEHLHKFVVTTGWQIYSTDDFENYELLYTAPARIEKVKYFNEINTIAIVCGAIIFSSDLENYTVSDDLDCYDITYCVELNTYVVAGYTNNHPTIYTSKDRVIWNQTFYDENVSKIMRGIYYSYELNLFIGVGAGGVIITSADGYSWTKNYYKNDSKTFYGIIDILEGAIIYGNSIILKYAYAENENEIQKLSSESNLNFPLNVGENRMLVSSEQGSVICKITYRQKYIGV